jgi:hypothetical protein
MLYAFKHELGARTARSILFVRERELRFYTRNILNIGAQAALLAGFAFKTLVQHESADVLEWITEYAPNETFADLARHAHELDGVEVAMTFIEIIYLTSTISAMGSTLYTLYICLITPILGLGLALRGSEGAVDRAVISLAGVNTSVIKSFGYALNLFQFSVLMKAFLTFQLLAAVVCTFFVVYYFLSIRRAERRIIKTFRIPPDQIVTGRFEASGRAPTHWKEASRALSRRAKSAATASSGRLREVVRTASAREGTLKRSDSLRTVYTNDPYVSERRAERHEGAQFDNEVLKPSVQSERMMYRVQGPLPRERPDEVL